MGLTACRPRTQHFRLHYLLQNHQGDQQRGGEFWLIYYDLDTWYLYSTHNVFESKIPFGNCMDVHIWAPMASIGSPFRYKHFKLHYLIQNHQGDQQRGGELWLIYYDLDSDTGIHSHLKLKILFRNCMIKPKAYFVSMLFGICMIYFQQHLNSFLGVFDHK